MLKQVLRRLVYSAHQLRYGRPQCKIFFLHIPKCGGTSINNAIRNSYLNLNPNSELAVAHLDPYAAHEAALLAGLDPLAYVRDLSLYFLGNQAHQYVAGHFSFSEAAYQAFHHHYRFVTLLRDPVDKWLSLYFYNRYKENDFFRIEAELDEFVHSSTAIGYGCDYVMQFAGNYAQPGMDVSAYTTTQAIIHATENLRKFHLVGCLEHLDIFEQQFQKLCGISLQIPMKNRNPLSKAAQRKALSPAILATIQELCKPNYEIYNYAVEHLVNSIRLRKEQKP